MIIYDDPTTMRTTRTDRVYPPNRSMKQTKPTRWFFVKPPRPLSDRQLLKLVGGVK